MIMLVPRTELSAGWRIAAPFVAVALAMAGGALLFALLGKPPLRALYLVFVSPLTTLKGLSELIVKATPLILIATGLAIGFRAGVWNIGAEGQFTIGALTGGAVALAVYPAGGLWLLPLMALAGMAGGIAWAMIPAILKTRFRTNEILTSLMLVYIAGLALSALVHGPLKDPEGQNFPESRLFQPSAQLPALIAGTRAHIGFLVALGAAAAAYVLVQRTMIGLAIRAQGLAPAAASFAGFSEKRLVWLCFAISGGLAGLAGMGEAAGPVGQLVPALPVGYGFTAIIAAFLGRLHAGGVLLASLVLALTYIGGEAAQIAMSLPSATTAVFQGLVLFFMLAVDVLVTHRLERRAARRSAA
jgi:simple sugar transport system permease protein